MKTQKYPFLIIPVLVLFFSPSYKVQSAQLEKEPAVQAEGKHRGYGKL